MIVSLKKTVLLALSLAAFAAPAFAVKDLGNAGDVIATTKGGDYRTVSVTGDASLAGWASKAVASHGAFEVKPGASLRMSFTRVSDTAVRVTLSGAESFEATAQGRDEMDALWRAVDAAIVVAGKKYAVKPMFAATKLAFVRELGPGRKEIYAGDLMLPSASAVTGHGKLSYSPHWAPDGKSVYYTSHFRSGAADVFRTDLGSRAVSPVATYKGTNTGGAVSPDGSRVALALSPKGTSDIYVASASGAGARAIVATSDVEMSPDWSPDGREIAYTGGVSGRPQIMIVPASGGAARRLSSGHSYATEPAWNPVNPSQIAFSYGAGGGLGVGVADVGGAARDVVEKAGRSVSHPTWCADGRHLVVTIGAGRTTQLGLLDSESGKLTVLSGPSFGNCSDPAAHIGK